MFQPPSDSEFPGGSSNLYVHLPFCRQFCPHCPYTKAIASTELHTTYATALRREIELYLDRQDPQQIQTLYFGGGTPSVTPEIICEAIDVLRRHLAADAEVGVEVHPSDARPTLFSQLRTAGVNRVSLGIESFRPDLLRKLGRRYSPSEAEAAIIAACDGGFGCVDVNLICAIPGQESHNSAADARRCLDLGVDQISTYTLFTFAHTPMGRRVTNRREPLYGDRSRISALQQVSRICRAEGFVRTSPWNFTRQGIAPYSTVCREDYIGFGVGAGSKVDGAFWFNTFSIDEYMKQTLPHPAIVLKTTPRIKRAHWVYWALYRMQVDPQRYKEQFGGRFERDFRGTLTSLRLLHMVERDGSRWRVTEFGAIWLHRLQQLFSITYIDDVWEQCRRTAWPEQVTIS